MGKTSKLVLVCALVLALIGAIGGVAVSAESEVGAETEVAVDASNAEPNAGNEVTAIAVAERFQDGPNGTVFTLTTFVTPDGTQITVRTHGGIRSDGIGQLTSHEAHFFLGREYGLQLAPELASPHQDDDGEDGEIFRVVGGEKGVTVQSAFGEAVHTGDNTPNNFALLPFSWNWTLPDNPPVFVINPNAPDAIDEVALVQQGFSTWEDDPDSSMDWTYGGTTSLATVANDGTNVVFWADTPDPTDTFLARANTFYSPATGQAVDTDIIFNNDYNWVNGAAGGAFDVLSVAIHESGHSLGLDHAPNNTAIMFESIGPNTMKRNLSLGDKGGVATIYPPAPAGDASVSGTVAFDTGAPISGVGLDLFTENRASYVTSATTDNSGNYSITLPSAGCYVITFIAPQGQTFTNASQYLNASFCANAGQAVTNVDAQVISPGSATSASGDVTDGNGAGVSGVGLDLFTENRASYLASATTDGSGNFNITLPGAGCYVITFIAPQGETFASGGQYLNTPFCANAGQNVGDLNGQLAGGASQATLGDSVTNANGGGESGVEVVLYQANGDGSRGSYLQSAFTNGSGIYSLSVAPGCYVLDFVAPSGRTWVATGGQYQQLAACVSAGDANLSLDGILN